MGAIQKICEDSADMLTPQEHLSTLIPKLLYFFNSPSPKLRLMVLSDFIYDNTSAVFIPVHLEISVFRFTTS